MTAAMLQVQEHSSPLDMMFDQKEHNSRKKCNVSMENFRSTAFWEMRSLPCLGAPSYFAYGFKWLEICTSLYIVGIDGDANWFLAERDLVIFSSTVQKAILL